MKSPGAVAFTLFGIDIRWYGILITCGAALAILISCRRAERHHLNTDTVLDLSLLVLPLGIIGARAYYVFFDFDLYRNDLSSIFDIRQGGLAIHGGLLFGLAAALIYCHFKKISIFNVADLLLPSVALAQAIGRWGNFFNSEAHGTPTDLPWAILVDGQYVHPTFLYESLWCLVIFLVLSYLDRKPHFEGRIACLYGLLYAPERFLVEGLRTDSLMIGPLRQAQVISIIIFIACLLLYFYLKKRSDAKEVV